jgi:osmotically-inducible protein OsmY
MLRALVRIIVVVVIVVAAAAFLLGYRWGGGRSQVTTSESTARQETAVGTRGDRADTTRERAREAGAEIGEKVAVGAQKASETLEEAGLTTKVKSKVALDDTLDGSRIHVTTDDSRVTLTGTVINDAQHRRALELARETDGVSTVVDHLSVGSAN